MKKSIIVRTIDGNKFFFHFDDIYRYDFEYSPTVLRIDFKNGGFVEFTRSNIISAQITGSKENNDIAILSNE